MSDKNYIKLKFTDYGYEIYAITGSKRIKLNQKDKMIMYNVLKQFECIKKNDNIFIFPNYRLITLYFSKEKLKHKPKKVNRIKSSQIISTILLLATLLSGAKNMNNNTPEYENEQPTTGYETVYEDDETVLEFTYDEESLDIFGHLSKLNNENGTLNNSQHDNNQNNLGESDNETELALAIENMNEFNYEYGSLNNNQHINNENNLVELDNELEVVSETETINEFNYEYETPNDKAALTNAEEYMEVFSKYEKIYGIDANLLCAIGAQESSGIHHSQSKNGGYATGLMGIEYIWDGGEIIVFNFETNCYETIVVDYSRIGELDYNIKIGAAIYQNYFYNTLRNVDSIEETDYLAFTLQKYNMGPGNMSKVLSYGGNWIDNRDMINAGDRHYFEHVLSRLDNDTVISIRLDDGSYYKIKLVNKSLENQYSRA